MYTVPFKTRESLGHYSLAIGLDYCTLVTLCNYSVEGMERGICMIHIQRALLLMDIKKETTLLSSVSICLLRPKGAYQRRTVKSDGDVSNNATLLWWHLDLTNWVGRIWLFIFSIILLILFFRFWKIWFCMLMFDQKDRDGALIEWIVDPFAWTHGMSIYS